ncbi:MAG: TIGR03905 family TSCPD domain-containing protein [Firmicutes bacterium]|nr:TIGR03905 family TSCPD domain-containing protein [Bacillota bacterium]MDD7602726.1 TIGR03905 family TSCPD domain-containing protein [Bacillota bacterium]MDY5857224.1 TIGR03905 family TSCPD domain-containing protein [Anaerovoracaceae bacterium]
MTYKYITSGTCSREITVEMEGDVLKHVSFFGGCNGNLQGISKLVEGMTYEQLKDKLSGIRCGFKSTSCPDQLVKAVEAAMAQQRKNG